MIDKTARANLLTIATAYAAATGLSLSTVSKRIHGKQRFLEDLRDGRCTVSLENLGNLVKRFSGQWPVGAKWPKTKPVSFRRPRRGDERP